MTDQSKRQFFRELMRQGAATVAAFREGVEQARHQRETAAFFESYENSYALTLAYPDDILLETARRAGIRIEGREKKDIVRELFEKQGDL